MGRQAPCSDRVNSVKITPSPAAAQGTASAQDAITQAKALQYLSSVYTSTTYPRLDALWIARWDGSPSLTGWSGISDGKWANRQRGKQYTAATTPRPTAA